MQRTFLDHLFFFLAPEALFLSRSGATRCSMPLHSCALTNKRSAGAKKPKGECLMTQLGARAARGRHLPPQQQHLHRHIRGG